LANAGEAVGVGAGIAVTPVTANASDATTGVCFVMRRVWSNNSASGRFLKPQAIRQNRAGMGMRDRIQTVDENVLRVLY
jgi:hypothetical protein